MSTISIMPISTKFRVTRRTQIPYSRKLSASANIEKASMILGKELILEEGTIIRVDGFSSRTTDASYPDVKLSVFPEGGKMGSIYVELNELDGLTWEPFVDTKEETKKDRGPIRRYDVSLNDRGVDPYWVWHSAFNERYDVQKSELKMVNPLALTEAERAYGFRTEDLTNVGEALFTYEDGGNRSKHSYVLQVRTIHRFESQIMEGGLLGAKCVSTQIKLEIGDKWQKDNEYIGDIEINETDVVKLVKDWMKEKHKN